MQEPFLTIVTGFPRCGSSLLMRMLFHGGCPVIADSRDVAFESRDVGQSMQTQDWVWLLGREGEAVKILEPLYLEGFPPKGLRVRFLLMQRDPTQQARSFLKFNKIIMGQDIGAKPDAEAVIRDSFVADFPKMEEKLKRIGPVYRVRFEDLVQSPTVQARRIAVLLGMPQLDVDSMARQVISRGTDCLPYMLEEHILGASRPAFQRSQSGIILPD